MPAPTNGYGPTSVEYFVSFGFGEGGELGARITFSLTNSGTDPDYKAAVFKHAIDALVAKVRADHPDWDAFVERTWHGHKLQVLEP